MERPIPRLAPSILSADFARLGHALNQCADGNAEWVHVDVMDGHFVPNLTIGPPVVSSLRAATDLFLDVHLMITAPEKMVDSFITAGADGITFHYEATEGRKELITKIRETGKAVGLSIKPQTSVDVLKPYLPDLDLILLMSVEPGFGGQTFLPGALDRIREVRYLIDEAGRTGATLLEIDGGITSANAAAIVKAGGDILVAGSAIFHTPNPTQTIREFNTILGKEG